jgi:hypothetical protein
VELSNRRLTVALGVVTAVTLVSIGLNVWLSSRLGAAEDRLDETRVTLSRVQDGLQIVVNQATELFDALDALGPTAGTALDDAIAQLEGFSTATIEFRLPFDESIPIDTEIVIDRTVQVPIRTTLPIDESFDTRITVAGPFGIDIPLSVTVPIRLDLPIDLVVDIPFNESFPVSTEVPIRLDVPISVDVAGTELAGLAEALRTGLVSIRDAFAALG